LTAAVCDTMAGVDDEECTLVSHEIRSHNTHNNHNAAEHEHVEILVKGMVKKYQLKQLTKAFVSYIFDIDDI